MRCCWAYGPEDHALNRLLGYAERLPFLPVFGSGKELLTPLFVEDIGRFFTHLVAQAGGSSEAPTPGGGRDTTFGLGGPDLVTLNDFLKLALELKGLKQPILHVPKALGKLGAALVQYLPGRPLTPSAVDFIAQGGAVSEMERNLLKEHFPEFTLTPLREGLAYLQGPQRKG